MYDMNWLLSVVSQCSATIVAILGGFIASRLLTIHTERKETLLRIKDVDTEINFKSEQALKLKEELLVKDAYRLVSEKVGDIVSLAPFKKVLDEKNYFRESTIEELQPFWDKAQRVYQDYIQYGEMNRFSQDDIPKEVSDNFDGFELFAFKKIAKYLTAKRDKAAAVSPVPKKVSAEWNIYAQQRYQKIADGYYAIQSELKWLEKQKELLQLKAGALQQPYGMKQGLILFSYFSLVGIITPMSLMPFVSASTLHQVIFVKWIVVGLFASGIVFTLIYLAIFLRNTGKKAA